MSRIRTNCEATETQEANGQSSNFRNVPMYLPQFARTTIIINYQLRVVISLKLKIRICPFQFRISIENVHNINKVSTVSVFYVSFWKRLHYLCFIICHSKFQCFILIAFVVTTDCLSGEIAPNSLECGRFDLISRTVHVSFASDVRSSIFRNRLNYK